MNNEETNKPLDIAEIDRRAMRAAFEKAAPFYDVL